MRLNLRNFFGVWQDIEVRAGVAHAAIAQALRTYETR